MEEKKRQQEMEKRKMREEEARIMRKIEEDNKRMKEELEAEKRKEEEKAREVRIYFYCKTHETHLALATLRQNLSQNISAQLPFFSR